MNAEDDADDVLMQLAEKIAEGTTVDPDEEHERADQHSNRGALNALLDIAAIGAAHQSAERSFDRMQPPALDVPRRWAHLTILEKIGEGEFGEVYRAHDSRLQIDVALKLSAVGARQSLDAPKVLDEARLLAKVRHPNVVRVYGADHKQGRVGLWMDLVLGQTLEELTKTQGFGASEATNIGIELCRALAAVHAVGVIHGDIKAHNVMRRDGGQIVLVDFGAGRPIAAEPRTGNDIVGTPVYMAPEVLNDQPRSAASDIYSLGVLLFHLVSNDYPVYATSRADFIEAHKTGARKRLRDIRPDLPDGFIHLVDRATATVPQSRFSSAGALETELVHLLAPPEPAPVPSTTHDWRLWAAGVSAAAILSMGAAFWGTGRVPGSTAGTSAVASGPAGTDVALRADSYAIEAAFYRMNGAAGRERLSAGQSVKVSDEISLSVSTSAPTYLYVVNEDEQDEAYLLFPLPGQTLTNPLPANREVRVPAGYNWQVSSAGGREHFLVFASRERLSAFEDAFRLLPPPRVGGSGQSQRLPAATLENFRGLRGVGGLTPTEPDRPTSLARFRTLFTQPLSGREVAEGLWVRQLTLDNASGRR
jgi:serine/threonine protein kinase